MQETIKKRDLLNVIKTLSEYYDKTLPDKNIINVYWIALCKYTQSELQQAVLKHIACPYRGTKYPLIADLVKHLEPDHITLSEILAQARVKNTPLGVMAADYIGSHDLKAASNEYLWSRANEIKQLLPKWHHDLKAGLLSDHTNKLLKNNGFNLNKMGLLKNEL